MSKLLTFAQVAAISLAGTFAAQAAAEEQTNQPKQQQNTDVPQAPAHEAESANDKTRPHPRPSTTRAEGTAADRTPPGATPKRGEPGVGTGVNPAPSTSPTEGTAADRTPPGETPTNVFRGSKQSKQESSRESPTSSAQAAEQRRRAHERSETRQQPLPSTRRTEGTAADRTPPGATPTRGETGVGTGVNPAPSTSPTEGTAADRTPPGETPTKVFRKDKKHPQPEQDPQPQ